MVKKESERIFLTLVLADDATGIWSAGFEAVDVLMK
jgi:hypothetical protein